MTTDTIIPLQQRSSSSLPYAVNGLIEDLKQIFSGTNHQLVALVRSQEELDLIAADFKTIPFLEIKLLTGNVFEPYFTEQIYKSLKGASIFPSNYWDTHMEDELCEFSNNIEALDILSRRYKRHKYETYPGYEIELTFVVSNPESPLMAVYHGTKVMVYNFSDR
jgi:short-subunit dehydrogenase